MISFRTLGNLGQFCKACKINRPAVHIVQIFFRFIIYHCRLYFGLIGYHCYKTPWKRHCLLDGSIIRKANCDESVAGMSNFPCHLMRYSRLDGTTICCDVIIHTHTHTQLYQRYNRVDSVKSVSIRNISSGEPELGYSLPSWVILLSASILHSSS